MMAFNNLSYYVDYYDKGLYYVKPEKIFELCKKNISLKVKIRHDYQIKKKLYLLNLQLFYTNKKMFNKLQNKKKL